jgi:predicted aspartyl protease
MHMTILNLATLILLVVGDAPTQAEWRSRADNAVGSAETFGTADELRKALDLCWRADYWQPTPCLVHLIEQRHGDNHELLGLGIRALWRAGRLDDAVRLAEKLDVEKADRIGLRTVATIELARGNLDRAIALVDRLEKKPRLNAEDYAVVFAIRFEQDRLRELPAILRNAEAAIDPAHGYPETYLGESLGGVADFLDAIDPEPVNQIARTGAAPMPQLPVVNWPSCDVMINGKGPFRLLVDTGGSTLIALDTAAAKEAGVKSLASAKVRGVSGLSESGQALIDTLDIGTIRCERVLTRVFDVRSVAANLVDGILGTGIFANGRMTLDFQNGQLIIAESQSTAAPGKPVPLYTVSDAKLVVPATLDNEPVFALLDTGADAVVASPHKMKLMRPDRPWQKMQIDIGIGVGQGDAAGVSWGAAVDLNLAGRDCEGCVGLALAVLDDTLSPVIGVQVDVLIGMPLFREMRSCTVDYPRGKLWIDWPPED